MLTENAGTETGLLNKTERKKTGNKNRKKFSINKDKLKKTGTVLLFILPALIPLAVFWIYPLCHAVFMSFTDWDYMTSDFNFVGFANYISIFKSPEFYAALKNTLIFTLGTLIPTLVIALALAFLLKEKLAGSAFYKAVIFSPWVTPMVVVSIVWSFILEPKYGIMNQLLNMAGLPGLQWLQSSDTAMFGVILVTVWKGAGWSMIFYLTALEKVPEELYEAADVDGASKSRKFFKITLPLISPTTFFLTIITTVNSLQAYDQIQVLTQGGPSGSTRTLLYMYYQTAFENFDIGKATAMAVVMLILISTLSAVQFIASKKWVHY